VWALAVVWADMAVVRSRAAAKSLINGNLWISDWNTQRRMTSKHYAFRVRSNTLRNKGISRAVSTTIAGKYNHMLMSFAGDSAVLNKSHMSPE
jgi:hypothetical protein